jgi:16S rRNA (adenine1518-N6/adenine1519-N6)-dimethyltransferase
MRSVGVASAAAAGCALPSTPGVASARRFGGRGWSHARTPRPSNRDPDVTRVIPKKAYGQHFLTDTNILGVIGRLAGPDADDVVLEVGPGLGVLTRYLAERVRLVHAVEIDRALAPKLQAAVADLDNVDLVIADALQLDLTALDPAPTKLIANLPYNIATPIVLETLTGVPSLSSWCVMVQREVADRFFAQPSTKAYGAVSVMIALHAERTGLHPVARTVFWPPPNVDSALVAFRRLDGPLPGVGIRRVVDGAFRYRRKTLANALSIAGVATREAAVAALDAVGHPANVRAEALPPSAFVALAEALGA